MKPENVKPGSDNLTAVAEAMTAEARKMLSQGMSEGSIIKQLMDKWSVDRSLVSKCVTAAHQSSFDNINDTWPKTYKCRFIEPGLVHYQEYGTVLVQKPALDQMAQSFVGKPVIDEAHAEVAPAIYAKGEADGIVTRVWYDNTDGWYWAEYLVWNPVTQRHCESGAYSVSCAYSAQDFSTEGGRHNSLVYDQEILSGVYDHLAIVTNPRYEGARIIYNSKGGKTMFLKFFKNKDDKQSQQIDLENAVIEVDGKETKVGDLIQVWNDSHPTSSVMSKIGEESLIDIDGKQVPIKDMVNAYKDKIKNDKDKEDEETKKKNAADEDEKKKKEDERKNAEDADKKKKEDEERKNAEDKEKKEKEDMKNAEDAKKSEHFNKLKNASELRGEPQTPTLVDRRDKIAMGAKRYGSPDTK